MNRIFLIFFIGLMTMGSMTFAQQSPEKEVRQLLDDQVEAWNDGDIESFMQGYWVSDSLTFIGSSGLTKGWQQTLENYKNGYPSVDAMGTLSFDLDEVRVVDDNAVMVVGKYILERKVDKPTGYFLLVVQRINGEWKIIADHSSASD